METRLAFFLSASLSPPTVRVILTTYRDVDVAFFNGQGYSQTLSQLIGNTYRDTRESVDSHKLLCVLQNMLTTHGKKAVKDVYSMACALSVPVFHVLFGIPEDVGKEFLNHASKRYVFTEKSVLRQKLLLHTGFDYFKKSVERNGWYRYAYEVYCVARTVTKNFTLTIDGSFSETLKNGLKRTNEPLYSRLGRLLEEVFGEKYENVLGTAILPTSFNVYLVLYDIPCVPFRYSIKPVKHTPGTSMVSNNHNICKTPIDTFDWFLAGRYQPSLLLTETPSETKPQTDLRCVLLDYPESEATVHVNVQVAHVKVYSKERIKHAIYGKSLVHTVIKKKTMACSSYKAVRPDGCVPTSNSLNFNIHGYDVALTIGLLIVGKYRKKCSFDEMEPITVSHTRMSTHSFQNGIQNINHYRQRMMENNIETCSKVPHFPVVKMTDMGLLHRESVLMNLKRNSREVAKNIYAKIRASSETDERMAALLYHVERRVGELVDNHVLGIIKTAFLFGMEDLARSLPDVITFDRILVGLNPKTTKSEFADKSKFDSESKGKASKKIKVCDKRKDRKSFLERISSVFPDVFIDYSNANSRGKWSFVDRINHSPDIVFYSPMTKMVIEELQRKYTRDVYPSFNDMLSIIYNEIQ